jgi:hypothetical protein
MSNEFERIWMENVVAYFKGLRDSTENLSQDGRFSGWDLSPVTPEYEAGVSNTRSRSSVFAVYEIVLIIILVHGNALRFTINLNVFQIRETFNTFIYT